MLHAFMLFFSLTRPCASVTVLSLWDRNNWPWYYLVKILIGYDNPKAHWVHEQRCGQREQLCAPRRLLGCNRSLDPFRNYILCTNLCFWSDKISISQLNIYGCRGAFLAFWEWIMLYTMKCFRKIHCKDTHSFYFRITYRNLYSQLKVCLGGERWSR